MRFSRPSTGTILGAIALFIALGGTAFAAGATVVNVADPTTPAHVAHVNASGRLEVAGPVSVTNTVNTELAAPSAYVQGLASDISSGSCVVVATAPSGKAMIIRDVKVNLFADSSPGAGNGVLIFGDTTCSNPVVAALNPPTVGETTWPFDPGLGIPAGSGVSAELVGSVGGDVFAEGYSVPSSAVPATAAQGAKTTGPSVRGLIGGQ